MQELIVLPVSIYGTNLVQKCHNQKNCQEVSQSKEHQESATIKSTSRKWHNQKVLPESATIMGTARQYHKTVHQGSATIKSTSRECRNQKYCQGVSQSKVPPGSVTIKSTARDRHNQKYCQGPSQSKVLPGSAAIKYKQGVQQIEVNKGVSQSK